MRSRYGNNSLISWDTPVLALPLAATRERVVQWIFSEREPTKQDNSFHALAFYGKMCSLVPYESPHAVVGNRDKSRLR
jgi:hypothetical protein